jgi:hypothetical protein
MCVCPTSVCANARASPDKKRQKVKPRFLPVYLGFEGKASFAFKPLKPHAKPARLGVALPLRQKRASFACPFLLTLTE